MAQQIQVQMIDDLDGQPYEDITTVEFALDGVTYEIDLNGEHADQLRDVLSDFVDAARRTGGRFRRGTGPVAHTNGVVVRPGGGGSGRSREQLAAIREWARNKDNWPHEVSDRGRLAQGVLEAFDEAHKAQPGKGSRRTAPRPAFTG
jgi:hypothetical protein